MNNSWSRHSNEVLARLQDLVSIESVNPGLPGGQRGEVEVANYIEKFFTDLDITCQRQPVYPGRDNVIATLPGKRSDRTLLFECHMDTASAEMMNIPPFDPHIRKGNLYGRGSCDTKAGGAAMMMAMKDLKIAGIKPNSTIQYAGVVDEENGFGGALALANESSVTAVVVAEPTDLSVVRSHKGLARFRIRAQGVAAHSSKPYLGVNAILQMTKIIKAIEEQILPTYHDQDHPLVGSPTLNIGLISGGTQINFVPDQCVIEIDRRTIPGEKPSDAILPFQQLIEQMTNEDREFEATVEAIMLDNAMETEEHEEIVQISHRACQNILGQSTITGVPYGTDASKFTIRGIPSIVLGPGSIDQAHSAVEWVECQQVIQAVDIYRQIMLNF